MKLTYSLKKTCCLVMAAASIGGAALAATPQDTYEEAARNMAAHPQGAYTLTLPAATTITSSLMRPASTRRLTKPIGRRKA